MVGNLSIYIRQKILIYSIHTTQKVNDPINKWFNNNSQKDEVANKHLKRHNQSH